MVEAPSPAPTETSQQANERPIKFLRPKERIGASGKEKDAGMTAFAAVLKKGNQLLKEKEGESNHTSSQKEIAGFAYIARQALGSDGDFKGMDFQVGVPIFVDGKKVLEVKNKVGVNFNCLVEGEANPVEVPAETILGEQLKITYEQTQNTDDFTVQEKTIIKAYIESLQGSPESTDALDDNILSEVAFSSGLIRAESVRTYTNKYRVDTSTIDTSNPEGQKQKAEADQHNQVIEKLIEPLAGRVIAEPEVIGSLIQNFGTVEIDTAKALLEAQRQELIGKPDKVKDLEAVEVQLTVLTEVSSAIQNSTALTEDFFQSVQMGETDIAEVQAVDTSLANGDTQSLMEHLSKKNFNEQDKKKVNHIQDLYNKHKDKFKMGGILSLGLFFLLIKKALGESLGGGSQNQ